MYDVLVVGLGAVGSATTYELATRGVSVIGVDAFAPPHANGSTHGKSRIIREAYFEHPSYVPLVRRAFSKWAALEAESGEVLYRQTGGLSIGRRDSGLVAGVLRSAREHGLDVEELTRDQMQERYPAFTLEPEMVAVVERNAGMLMPEACVNACLRLAAVHGAELLTGERVIDVQRRGTSFIVSTSSREITARRVVLCAGAWNPLFFAMLGINVPLVVTRQTMHWLAPMGDEALRAPDRFPVTLIDHGDDRIFYTMPDTGDGVKAAIHHEGAITQPGEVNRGIQLADTAPVVELCHRFIASVAGPIVESVVCLYSNTPDQDFAIGIPASVPGVVVVSACSGHGFKFASAIGEAAAQLALDQPLDMDLSHFAIDRFNA
jgi:sarcosine oxidase